MKRGVGDTFCLQHLSPTFLLPSLFPELNTIDVKTEIVNFMNSQLVEDERKRCRRKKDGYIAQVWTGTQKISKFDLMDEFNQTFTKDEFTKHIGVKDLDFKRSYKYFFEILYSTTGLGFYPKESTGIKSFSEIGFFALDFNTFNFDFRNHTRSK